MTSPLFFSLGIATAGYRFDLPDSIVFTNSYDILTAEMQTQVLSYDLTDTTTSIDLQNNQFSIDYPKGLELALLSETISIDEG